MSPYLSHFLLGAATVPAIALVVGLVVLVCRLVAERWDRYRPTFIKRKDLRAKHAASIAVARRVLVVRLPGGRFLAWRSNVSHMSDEAYTAWSHVMDGLDSADKALQGRKDTARYSALDDVDLAR